MMSDILAEGWGSNSVSVRDSFHKTIHLPQITSTEGLHTNNATMSHTCHTQSSCLTQHLCREERPSSQEALPPIRTIFERRWSLLVFQEGRHHISDDFPREAIAKLLQHLAGHNDLLLLCWGQDSGPSCTDLAHFPCNQVVFLTLNFLCTVNKFLLTVNDFY